MPNPTIITVVNNVMPTASPNSPSRSAASRVQPTASGTMNAAGSNQRVTTAAVRRP